MDAYTIKPLRWQGKIDRENYTAMRCDTNLGSYAIFASDDGGYSVSWAFDERNDGSVVVRTIKEAKEWVWRDWQARIMPNLRLVTM